jgi:hypothetical protein
MLQELEQKGVSFVIGKDDTITAKYDITMTQMTQEVRQMILDHKDELKGQVLAREKKLQDSLKAIMHQLEKVPAVYARSAAIGEQVAFVRDGYKGVKPGVTVVYTLSELRGLLDMPSKEWEFMHLSKKTFGGGRIISKEG